MSLIPRDNLIDFDRFFGDFWPATQVNRGNEALAPRVDVHEKDNRYLIDAELPGIDKDHLNVTLEDGTLTIDATMEDEQSKEEEGRVIRRERRYGRYSRSFYLGENVSESDISASFKDGILKLEIPKSQPALPEKRRIEVN